MKVHQPMVPHRDRYNKPQLLYFYVIASYYFVLCFILIVTFNIMCTDARFLLRARIHINNDNYSLWKTTLLSFMTLLLVASNPTDTKTMRVSWALLLLPPSSWLADSDAAVEGFLFRPKVIYRPETRTRFLHSSLDHCANLTYSIYSYRSIYSYS